MRFDFIWALLLFVPLALALWIRRKKQPIALSFSETAVFSGLKKSWRQRIIGLPVLLEIAAITLLIIAAARPQLGQRQVSDIKHGIAIEMAMDVSSSMDIWIGDHAKNQTRLEAAKNAFEQFVVGNKKNLTGRSDDLIGLITFARYADTICPLTLDHKALLYLVGELEVESRPNEDGTAYGDAIALAAARLKQMDKQAESRGGKDLKSRIIILLTDGENNCGKHLPKESAALAKKWGIRIYTIRFGSENQTQVVETRNGRRRVPRATSNHEKTLRAIAEYTGGIYRSADDADSLRSIYSEIDRLEKGRIEKKASYTHRDIYPWFAGAGLLLLVIESVLSCTILRRVP